MGDTILEELKQYFDLGYTDVEVAQYTGYTMEEIQSCRSQLTQNQDNEI